MSLKIALSDLMNKMKKAGDEHLPKSYAIGKGYAAAKSGHEVIGSPLDSEVVAARVGFNEEKIIKMVNEMEEKILAIKPSAYASTTEYMADVDRIFNAYAGRAHAYAYYSEQLFLDGWIQGGREVAGDLGDELGVPSGEIGFTWHTMGDERVCPTCEALDGQWFPLGNVGEDLDLAWEAHIGCLSPGQKIETSHGKKNIEDIKVGDSVLTHKGNHRKATKISKRKYKGEMYRITCGGNFGEKTIHLTPEHPVLTQRGWVEAQSLEKLEVSLVAIMEFCASYNRLVCCPFNIKREHYEGYVYNFAVQEDESYIAEGITVHNCRCPDNFEYDANPY